MKEKISEIRQRIDGKTKEENKSETSSPTRITKYSDIKSKVYDPPKLRVQHPKTQKN